MKLCNWIFVEGDLLWHIILRIWPWYFVIGSLYPTLFCIRCSVFGRVWWVVVVSGGGNHQPMTPLCLKRLIAPPHPTSASYKTTENYNPIYSSSSNWAGCSGTKCYLNKYFAIHAFCLLPKTLHQENTNSKSSWLEKNEKSGTTTVLYGCLVAMFKCGFCVIVEYLKPMRSASCIGKLGRQC